MEVVLQNKVGVKLCMWDNTTTNSSPLPASGGSWSAKVAVLALLDFRGDSNYSLVQKLNTVLVAADLGERRETEN